MECAWQEQLLQRRTRLSSLHQSFAWIKKDESPADARMLRRISKLNRLEVSSTFVDPRMCLSDGNNIAKLTVLKRKANSSSRCYLPAYHFQVLASDLGFRERAFGIFQRVPYGVCEFVMRMWVSLSPTPQDAT